MTAESQYGPDSLENTETEVSSLPKVWIGFVLADWSCCPGLGDVWDRTLQGVIRNRISIGVLAYWLFCVQRFHKVLVELSNEYPITPDKAAAFHLIPLFLCIGYSNGPTS